MSITIKQLKDLLNKYPDDMIVVNELNIIREMYYSVINHYNTINLSSKNLFYK